MAISSTKDKEIVLITGANTGLGLEVARMLLKDHPGHFHVLVAGRTMSKVNDAVSQLHEQDLKDCEGVRIEVTDDQSIDEAVKTISEKFGRIDVLHVNVWLSLSTIASAFNCCEASK